MDEFLHVLKMNSYFIAWEFITNLSFVKITQCTMDEASILILSLNSWWMRLTSFTDELIPIAWKFITNVIIYENHSELDGWGLKIQNWMAPKLHIHPTWRHRPPQEWRTGRTTGRTSQGKKSWADWLQLVRCQKHNAQRQQPALVIAVFLQSQLRIAIGFPTPSYKTQPLRSSATISFL